MKIYLPKDQYVPKILIWDLEIIIPPSIKLVESIYRMGYKSPPLGFNADISIISHFGYKWYGEKESYCLTLSDYSNFSYEMDDRLLLKDAYRLMEHADKMVAHFGSKFDQPFIQTRFLLRGFGELPLAKMVDTWRIARNKLKLTNNKLDTLARTFGLDQKLEHHFPDWWIHASAGEIEYFKKMEEYCKGDVNTLEQVYSKIRMLEPDVKNISQKVFQGTTRTICNYCGNNKIQFRGYLYTASKKKKRYKCTSCYKWGSI